MPVDREGTREADFASRAEGMAPAQAIEIVWTWFACNWEDRDIPFVRSWLECELSLPALTPSRSDSSLSDGSGACGVRADRSEQKRTTSLLRCVRNICKIAIDIIDELDTTSTDCAKNGSLSVQ